MKLVNETSEESRNWNSRSDSCRLVSKRFEQVEPILIKKYGEMASRRCQSKLIRISAMYYLLGEIYGKTVLDLGCGSIFSNDHTASIFQEQRLYEPWLSRTLHELGARPIGIDSKHDLSEEFEGYKLNLCFPDSLKQFPDKSVDLACAFSLFDSPSLHYGNGFGAGRELFHCLIPQLERVVKDDGFFLFEPIGTGIR